VLILRIGAIEGYCSGREQYARFEILSSLFSAEIGDFPSKNNDWSDHSVVYYDVTVTIFPEATVPLAKFFLEESRCGCPRSEALTKEFLLHLAAAMN